MFYNKTHMCSYKKSMHVLLVVAAGLLLVKGQDQCGNLSPCLYPSSGSCKNVTLDPTGLDPGKSPYYQIMLSKVTGSEEFGSNCITYFALGNGVYLVYELIVKTDSSYFTIKSLRGDINGVPGAYRYEGNDSSLECGSCVYNDYTLEALQDECNGLYLVYRCPLYGECATVQAGHDIVYLALSVATMNSVTSSCESAAASAAQRQGLSPPAPFADQMRYRCVTRVKGLTAINAGCVPDEDSLEFD